MQRVSFSRIVLAPIDPLVLLLSAGSEALRLVDCIEDDRGRECKKPAARELAQHRLCECGEKSVSDAAVVAFCFQHVQGPFPLLMCLTWTTTCNKGPENRTVTKSPRLL